MLKRHQVLLTDWQTEHLKLIARQNDLSFSELIRVVLSEGFIYTAMTLHPECKTKEIRGKVEKISRRNAADKNETVRAGPHESGPTDAEV